MAPGYKSPGTSAIADCSGRFRGKYTRQGIGPPRRLRRFCSLYRRWDSYPAGTTFAGTGLTPAGLLRLCTAHLSHNSHKVEIFYLTALSGRLSSLTTSKLPSSDESETCTNAIGTAHGPSTSLAQPTPSVCLGSIPKQIIHS